MSTPITILLADDHALLREVLRGKLEGVLDGVYPATPEYLTAARELCRARSR